PERACGGLPFPARRDGRSAGSCAGYRLPGRKARPPDRRCGARYALRPLQWCQKPAGRAAGRRRRKKAEEREPPRDSKAWKFARRGKITNFQGKRKGAAPTRLGRMKTRRFDHIDLRVREMAVAKK